MWMNNESGGVFTEREAVSCPFNTVPQTSAINVPVNVIVPSTIMEITVNFSLQAVCLLLSKVRVTDAEEQIWFSFCTVRSQVSKGTIQWQSKRLPAPFKPPAFQLGS